MKALFQGLAGLVFLILIIMAVPLLIAMIIAFMTMILNTPPVVLIIALALIVYFGR